jgi:hypothetical protein
MHLHHVDEDEVFLGKVENPEDMKWEDLRNIDASRLIDERLFQTSDN